MATDSTNFTGLDRKALKQPDGFVTGVSEALGHNTRWVLGSILGILIVAAVGGYILTRKESISSAARDAIYEARQTQDKELSSIETPSSSAVPSSVPSSAPLKKAAPDSSHLVLDPDVRMPQTVQAWKKIIDTYSTSAAGFEAELALGSLYFDHGQADKSIPYFEKAAQSGHSTWDRALAWSSVGHAFENTGKLSEAASAYEKALGQAGSEAALKGELLLDLGRVQETLDPAKAKQTYDRVLAELPNTESAKQAEQSKSQLH